DEPVQACPPSAWYRFRKLVRRNKVALAMAACVLLALAGIAGGIGWATRDRVARGEAFDKGGERLLGGGGPLVDRGNWPEALAEVERADKLLAAAGRTERPLRLFELRKDLSVAERLEQIYRERKPARKPMVIVSSGPGTERTSQAEQHSSEEDVFWGREQ